jgi:hypothetical protein
MSPTTIRLLIVLHSACGSVLILSASREAASALRNNVAAAIAPRRVAPRRRHDHPVEPKETEELSLQERLLTAAYIRASIADPPRPYKKLPLPAPAALKDDPPPVELPLPAPGALQPVAAAMRSAPPPRRIRPPARPIFSHDDGTELERRLLAFLKKRRHRGASAGARVTLWTPPRLLFGSGSGRLRSFETASRRGVRRLRSKTAQSLTRRMRHRNRSPNRDG